MCCGTARFSRNETFGTTMGQVKAELAAFGKVTPGDELSPGKAPATTGPCDLFLDASTPWTNRYYAAQVRSAGSDTSSDGQSICHYAVSLKEGHSSGWLRIACFSLAAILAVCFMFSGLWKPWSGILGLIALLLVVYRWIAPSTKAVSLSGKIIKKLEDLSLRA